MSYRILYPSFRGKKSGKLYRIRLPVMTVCCFLLFYVLVNATWKDGAVFLHSSILYFEELFENLEIAVQIFLREGTLSEDLSSVFSVFTNDQM